VLATPLQATLFCELDVPLRGLSAMNSGSSSGRAGLMLDEVIYLSSHEASTTSHCVPQGSTIEICAPLRRTGAFLGHPILKSALNRDLAADKAA
jgi:hypothetical protein